MKKFLIAFMSLIVLTGCTQAASDILSNVKEDFTNAMQGAKKEVRGQKLRGSDSPLSLQDEIDEIKAEKAREMAPVTNQISTKEAQLRKVILDTKLTTSQKKAKTAVLQKELATLKAQKEQIDEKYRQKIREFRYN